MWFNVVILASVVFVYWDATKNKIGKIPDEKGFFNLSAGMWATGTALLWIVVFPAYSIKRSELLEKAKTHPVEASARIPVLTGMLFFSALIVISVLSDPSIENTEVAGSPDMPSVDTPTAAPLETTPIDPRAHWPQGALAEVPSGAVVCTTFQGAIRSIAVAQNPYATQSEDCFYTPRTTYVADFEYLDAGGLVRLRFIGGAVAAYTSLNNLNM